MMALDPNGKIAATPAADFDEVEDQGGWLKDVIARIFFPLFLLLFLLQNVSLTMALPAP